MSTNASDASAPFDEDVAAKQTIVGVVGSPSTTLDITVDVTHDAREQGLVGSMVVVEKHFGPADGEAVAEVALATVTDVETKNQYAESNYLRGVISGVGKLTGSLAGERSDLRSAELQVQAVYTRKADGTAEPHGASLSMSPATGTPVHRVDNDLLTHLSQAAGSEGLPLYAIGDIYRMPGVRLPMNTPDFNSQRGAFHAGFFGASGAGKSWAATYYLMSQMRHTDMAFLVVDPQQQFSIEQGMLPGSLQGLADAQGRKVRVIDLLWDVQLKKNRALFCSLLGKTKFVRPILMSRESGDNAENLVMAVSDGLKQFDKQHSNMDWTETTAEDLTDFLIDHLLQNVGKVYTSKDAVERLTGALQAAQNDPTALCEQVKPVQLLFKDVNPDGTDRIPETKMLEELFVRDGDPRAYVVINMAAAGFKKVAGTDGFDSDIAQRLTDDGTKARLLKHLFTKLEREAEDAYASAPLTKSGSRQTLNIQVMFDEAARYAPAKSDDEDIKDLASMLGRFARELRKYGGGLLMILQEPHQLERSVWDQLASGFRAIGYGCGGRSGDLIRELLPDNSPMKLYRSFPSPAGSKKHSFMLMGAVSPLSFTTAPVFCTIVEDLDDWVDANPWLTDAQAAAVQFDPVEVEVEEVSEEEASEAFSGLGPDDAQF